MEEKVNIAFDSEGFPYNGKFPPKGNGEFHGYDTPEEECLFYDFAVQGYDLMVVYKGIPYYFMADKDCVWLSDEKFSAQIERFESENDVIEHFEIDGHKLIDIINELDSVEVF